MARRVKQADGSYCYTENCRIHDRSHSDSTGLQAVLADAKEAQRKVHSAGAARILMETINIDEGMAHQLSDQIIDTAFNSEEGVSAYSISAVLQQATNDPLGDQDADNLNASYRIYNSLQKNSIIRQGDEVILNENGERGTITEGDTGFGGVVRFNPENMHSRNSFAWFKASEVTKLTAGHNSLARERILAAPRDSYIPTSLIKQMMVEETNPKTRNPQVTREFSKGGDAATTKQMMVWFSDDLKDKYGERGVTKKQLINALNERINTPYPGQDHASSQLQTALNESKAGFRNILSYLDPKQ